MEDNKVVTQANENEIVLDALESYVVKDKSGKVLGEFHFDPSDADMPKRIQKVIAWFETVTVPEEEDSTEAFYKLSDELKQKINVTPRMGSVGRNRYVREYKKDHAVETP